MRHDGKRLERLREWLPEDEGVEVTPRSLSVYLGLDPAKWRSLERKESWTARQKSIARAGLEKILSSTTLDGEAARAAMDYAMSAAGDLPPLGSATWRPGHGPALERGRPDGTRLERGPDGRVRAILPPRDRPTPVELEPHRPAAPAEVVPQPAVEAALDAIRVALDLAVKHGRSVEHAFAAAKGALMGGMSAAGIAVAAGPHFWESLGYLAL